MAMQNNTEEKIRGSIAEILEQEISKVREEVIAAAVAEYEAKVRKAVGNAAVQVSEFYSVHRMGNDLVITVKLHA
jgi:hypothetical protein